MTESLIQPESFPKDGILTLFNTSLWAPSIDSIINYSIIQ